MTINCDCNEVPQKTVVDTQCMPTHSSYIQKYAAMMAENRERMYADKLNVDAAPAVSPHVSAIP